jgi:hypothetical protein
MEHGKKVYYNDTIKLSTLVPPRWPKTKVLAIEQPLSRNLLGGRSISISSNAMRSMTNDWRANSRRSLDIVEDPDNGPLRLHGQVSSRPLTIERKPPQPHKPLPPTPSTTLNAGSGLSRSLPDEKKIVTILPTAPNRTRSSISLSKQYQENMEELGISSILS